jgi:YHYH protein
MKSKTLLSVSACLLVIVLNSCCKHTTDITNAVLTNMSPDCSNYEGRYRAEVKDVGNSNKGFTANLQIKCTPPKCIFKTDGIPNHNFNDGSVPFPNKVSEQSKRFEITRQPTFAASVTPISLHYYNAILLNGAVVDLLSDGCCGVGDEIVGCGDETQPWRKDPMSPLAGFKPDTHNAHAQADGTYHYHGDPKALYDNSGTVASPVIGFAADGFPIYGPYINDHGTVRRVKSSYQPNPGNRPAGSCPVNKTPPQIIYDGEYNDDYEYVAGSGDLDECNGMCFEGHYAYYVTEKYPHIMKCFKGTPDSSFAK